MPVTFTPIGTGISATVVDGNFDECVRMLREQIVGADVKSGILDRWAIRQYTGGKVTKAEARKGMLMHDWLAPKIDAAATPDHLLRDLLFSRAGLGPSLKSSVHGATFELLGRPGPSFYWSFQEDGLIYGGVLPNVNRFPKDFCFSEWLTVPGASIKVYVPHPCKVEMKGSFWLQCLSPMFESPAGFSIAADGKTDFYPLRFGLVVDTNPELFSDEFSNTNPHILTPGTATMAPNVSWKFAEQETIYVPQNCKDDVEGSVHLKGGRWYNFSMKFKHASTRGYDNAGTLVDALYEEAVALANFNGARRQSAHKYPAEINWFSTSLSLEFIYGYAADHTNSASITIAP